jgi:hypothetical protein
MKFEAESIANTTNAISNDATNTSIELLCNSANVGQVTLFTNSL